MTEVGMELSAVQSLARTVLDGAGLVDGIVCPTVEPDALPGSAVASAARSPLVEERLADVVAHMRRWAAAAQASAQAIDAAQLRHARRLGGGR